MWVGTCYGLDDILEGITVPVRVRSWVSYYYADLCDDLQSKKRSIKIIITKIVGGLAAYPYLGK